MSVLWSGSLSLFLYRYYSVTCAMSCNKKPLDQWLYSIYIILINTNMPDIMSTRLRMLVRQLTFWNPKCNYKSLLHLIVMPGPPYWFIHYLVPFFLIALCFSSCSLWVAPIEHYNLVSCFFSKTVSLLFYGSHSPFFCHDIYLLFSRYYSTPGKKSREK